MTVDQIRTILDMPERSVEKFSHACAVIGVSIEKDDKDRWLIPSKGRGFNQQESIAKVLQDAFGAIDDWGILDDNTLRVWL